MYKLQLRISLVLKFIHLSLKQEQLVSQFRPAIFTRGAVAQLELLHAVATEKEREGGRKGRERCRRADQRAPSSKQRTSNGNTASLL